MSEVKQCPVCANPVSANINQCDRCGFNLVGSTERIEISASVGETPNIAAERGRAHLTLTRGPLKGEVFYLDKFPVIIGRDPSCDLFLNNMTVSREHAKIDKQADKIMISDCGSLNGTWVDGNIVDLAELFDGSFVQIGTFSMRFSYV